MDGKICRGGSSATLVTVVVFLIVLLWVQHSLAKEMNPKARGAPIIAESALLPIGDAITQGNIKTNDFRPAISLSVLRKQNNAPDLQQKIKNLEVAQREEDTMVQNYSMATKPNLLIWRE
jgi:hypothetical protein